jgi:hypothetical protein
VALVMALMLLVTMICLNVFVKEPEPEADYVHSFANVNVNWQNTFYPGSWGEGR